MKYTIEDAHESAAFITSESGYDVAVLRRCNDEDITDSEHRKHKLNDDEWQKLIDLVNAAPDLLEALELCLETLSEAKIDTSTSFWFASKIGNSKGIAKAAIAKARGN